MIEVQEYLKTNRFLKEREKSLLDLNTALENIKSADLKTRKLGEKRLSSNSRRELGWNCLPIREWFLNDTNKSEIKEVIKNEKDEKLLSGLLLTVCFFYERFIIHQMWKSIFDKKIESEYINWLKEITEFHIANESSIVKTEVAYILAILKDNKSWDIYNELLIKKNSISNKLYFACYRYAEYSITKKQIENFILNLDIIELKTKNAIIKRNVIEIKETLENINPK
ncbi:hypothetical protein HNQ02_003852 [Flavobacterium sp. 7E]|uniref:hypothetical protein n=1 Tax=Flavobacterium sp. 7E TaxID=2735898 RepID=UPI0015711423|nr:hypothetical protein [Flavobacterium sp. 7E]NRS90901.1 hypothetical protein [Flavobacterium sp. 7E]